MKFSDLSEKIIYKACILGKNKKQILKTPIIRILFIFKLIHTGTAYITPNNINDFMGFSSLTDNYSRYWNIDINVQKNNIFQYLINYQKRIKN